MKKPNKKDYDLNDHFEAVRLSSDLIRYIDYLEKNQSSNNWIKSVDNFERFKELINDQPKIKKVHAAKHLGVSRQTIHKYLKRLK